MLALAPPLHDRSSSHSAAVSSSITAVPRSKLAARRAQSSSALSSAPPSLSSSSSPCAFAPSASTATQTAVPRSGASASHARADTSLGSKQEVPSEPVATPLKPVDLQTSQHPALSVIPPMASPPPSDTGSDVDIHAYPTPDLLRVLASLLNQIAAANDGLSTPPPSSSTSSSSQPPSSVEHPPIWDTLFSASRTALSTPTSPLTFHARNIPSISLEAYLLRILRYCPTTNEVFLSLLVYFDRISKLAQEATGTRFVIDSYNVHRLVIAGITVASKFFSDVFYTNSRYAKVGGLPQAELNQLELQFLLLNDFRLAIHTDEMQRYAEQLIRFSEGQTGATDVQAWANSSTDSSIGRPSQPLQSMGAFDAFGGPITSDNAYSNVEVPRNPTPKHSSVGDATAALPDDERDRESIISNDTDWTDDEPTIRPGHSRASSETQSLFSNDGADDGADADDDDDDDESIAIGDLHPSQLGWNGRASESIDDEDRHMTSP